MAQAVPTRAAPAPATAKPPAAAPTIPAAARAPSPSSARAPPPASAAVATSAPAVAASAAVAKPSDQPAAVWRTARCLERPLAPPPRLFARLALAGARLRKACRLYLWRGHFVWWRAQSGRPRNPQHAVQPVLAALQGVEGPTLRKALTSCCSCSSSGNDRLSRLNAALPQPAAQARGPRRVQPVVAQGLAWVHASVVAVRQEAGPGELSGRAGERSSTVALVGCFKRSCGVDCGVRRRGLADGLRGIGESSRYQ